MLFSILLGAFLYLLNFALQLKVNSINRIYLDDIKILPSDLKYPRISIIVTGRNEENQIEQAIRSMVNAGYPNLEIIAVNDRSDDLTGTILNQIAADIKNVTTVHIDTLPSDWLGKTHALQQGLSIATGDWILFTDADIKFANDVLKKAVFICNFTKVEHLTIYPEILHGSILEKAFVCAFGLLFFLDRPTWRVEKPNNATHMGIGAFNLISRNALTNIGGLTHIRMSVDDDIRLGEMLKAHGYRTKVAFGVNHLSLKWQADLKSYITGFEKNAFASMDFKFALAAKAFFGIFAFTILPAIALLFFPTIYKSIAVGIFSILAIILYDASRNTKISPIYVFLLPVSGLLLAVSIFNSIIKTLKSGGIAWRGTFYPISLLKQHIHLRKAKIKQVRKLR